jgi:hypothetical protein
LLIISDRDLSASAGLLSCAILISDRDRDYDDFTFAHGSLPGFDKAQLDELYDLKINPGEQYLSRKSSTRPEDLRITLDARLRTPSQLQA